MQKKTLEMLRFSALACSAAQTICMMHISVLVKCFHRPSNNDKMNMKNSHRQQKPVDDTESQRANLLFPINLRAKRVATFNPASIEETLLAAQLMPAVSQLLLRSHIKQRPAAPGGSLCAALPIQ